MNDTKTKTIEILTLLISLITAIGVIAGGLFGYQYRDKWLANESKVNTSILEMEKSIKSLRDHLEIASKRASVSGEIANLITDLQPNVTIVQTKFVLNKDMLKLTYEITNHGHYYVIIEKPEVYLSNTHQYPSENSDEIISRDSYEVEALKLGLLPPDNTSWIREVDINLRELPKAKQIYSTVLFRIKTQPIILKIAKNFAGEILSPEELKDLDELSTRNFSLHATNTY